jgi:hypothetical protein
MFFVSSSFWASFSFAFNEFDIDGEDDGLKAIDDDLSLSFFCKSKLLFFFDFVDFGLYFVDYFYYCYY